MMWKIVRLTDVTSTAPSGSFLGGTLFTVFICEIKSERGNEIYLKAQSPPIQTMMSKAPVHIVIRHTSMD